MTYWQARFRRGLFCMTRHLMPINKLCGPYTDTRQKGIPDGVRLVNWSHSLTGSRAAESGMGLQHTPERAIHYPTQSKSAVYVCRMPLCKSGSCKILHET
jgi:hypothetical protein